VFLVFEFKKCGLFTAGIKILRGVCLVSVIGACVLSVFFLDWSRA
jgi:hypothetical protein